MDGLTIKSRLGVTATESVEGMAMFNHIDLCVHCARKATGKEVDLMLECPEQPDPVTDEYLQAMQYRELRKKELILAFTCPVEQMHYSNCEISGIAAPVVRCPLFKEKE